MWLHQQEAGRRDSSFDQEASGSSSPSTSSGPSASAMSWQKRMVLRALGPAGGRHVHCPFLTGDGCFGAALGCCGGCFMWLVGHAHGICVCVAIGALSEEALRRTKHRPTTHRSPFSSSGEDSSSDDGGALRGLDAEAIERSTVLSTVGKKTVVGKGVHLGAAAEEHCKCMICVEPFAKGDSLRTLPCLHRYHRHCIDEWLRRSCQCPICKHDVTQTSPRRDCPQGSRARSLSGGFTAVTRFRRRPWRRSLPRSGAGSFREALERTAR